MGCGNSRFKTIRSSWRPQDWEKLITLDIDPDAKPDILCDIEAGLPFADNTFDEVHAYEVMEHLRYQGDWKGFFQDFGEIYRVLKPFGIFCASTPIPEGPTAWSDPGHRRVLTPDTFQFLDQAQYIAAVGKSTMTDYRHVWKGDFRLVFMAKNDEMFSYFWSLQAIKPALSVPRILVGEQNARPYAQVHNPSSPVYLAPQGDTPGARTN